MQALSPQKHKADTFDARTLTAHTMLRRVTCSAHVGLGTSRLGSYLVAERGIQLIVVVRSAETAASFARREVEVDETA